MSLSNRPGILISGYHGFGNTGDDAILAAMLQALRAHLGTEADICVLSNNPAATKRDFEVRAVHRTRFATIIKEMLRASLFISGGGGLLQDSTGINTVRYYAYLMRLARLLGRPVMMYAQGIGPLESPRARAIVRDAVNGVQLVTVRDEESAELLREIGVVRPIVKVTADPVLALEPADNSVIDELLKREGLSSGPRIVGLSVRPWRGSVEERDRAVVDLGRHLIDRRGMRVLMLPFQDDQDREICERLAERIGKGAQVLSEGYSPREYLGIVGRLRSVVAMRLHALIFAAAQRVPTLGVSYDPKVAQFLARIGAPVLPLEGLNSRSLLKEADNLLDHGGQAKTDLARTLPGLVERAQENARLAGRLIRREQIEA